VIASQLSDGVAFADINEMGLSELSCGANSTALAVGVAGGLGRPLLPDLYVATIGR